MLRSSGTATLSQLEELVSSAASEALTLISHIRGIIP